MKIAHVSDIHIRNFKYRKEYLSAFEKLYKKLEELGPDLIINTGDTVHSKLAVSPELFDDVANHFVRVTDLAPYWVILGNHDLNLKNPGRMDAISPIIRALQGKTENELRMPEPSLPEQMLGDKFREFTFWNYDIRGHKDFYVKDSQINVGLYHGSISGCVTDQGFIMEDGEAEVSKFEQMDFVLLGDIHKRQSFRDGRVRYPGSLIQQNYGEEIEKGFLLWDIRSKDDFSVDFHPIIAPGRFYTIQVPANLDLSEIDIPKGSRVRAMVKGELSPSKRLELEKAIIEKFDPAEVITPDSSGEKVSMEAPDIDDLVESREQMMRDHLKDRGLESDEIDAVVKLFLDYEKGLDLDDSPRGTTWQMKSVSWDNMMNYGEGNAVDFTKLRGLVGVFAPNASGKSSIFDIFLQSLFDKVSKDVPRNIDLVNDNKDSGRMTVEFESGGQPFTIERSIERIHYGQRKLAETKQWGKTTLEFSSVDDSLNGTSRPETERAIRAIIGNFEDFVLTTMVSQNPIFGLPGGGDIINCRETDRRKILFRFLDLDVYEKVNQACKDDLKSILGSLKGQDREALTKSLEALETDLLVKQVDLQDERVDLETDERSLVGLRQELAQLEADDRAQDARNIVKLEDASTMADKRWKRAVETFERAVEADLASHVKLEKLLQSKPERPEMSLEELTTRMERIRTEREAAKVNLAKQRDTLTRGKRALVTLDGVPCEGKFPTCKFIKDASEFLTQRDIVEAALGLYETAADVANREISTLEGLEVMHVDVARWEREVIAAQSSCERLGVEKKSAHELMVTAQEASSRAKETLREAFERLDPTIGQQIVDVKVSIDKSQSLINDGKKRIEAILRQIGAFESKKQAIESQITQLDDIKRNVRIYEQVVELTGKTGLPYRILMLVLPIINDEISKILSGVVKFNVFFEDDSEEQTVSLFIRYGDYKSRPLSLGSGAEKFIASLAIRVALLSVSSLPKTDVLIIDEGFGKLDPEHLEALQKMFEYLREAFGTVFIVSHVDSMRDIVDHSLDITSLDGYAHLEAI